LLTPEIVNGNHLLISHWMLNYVNIS